MEELKTILLELVPAVLVVVGILSTLLIRKYLKNDSTATEALALENLTQEIVTQGIHYANKMADKRKKENIEMNSQEKLYMAIDYIESMLESNGIVEMAKEELESRIDAALNKEGV